MCSAKVGLGPAAGCEQRFDFAQQCRNLLFDCAPHQSMIHQVVAVNEHVAKCNDLAVFADAGSRFRIVLRKALHGLADDLETPLYGLSQDAVAVILRNRLALDLIEDERRRVPDVIEQLGRSWLHRWFGASCWRIR